MSVTGLVDNVLQGSMDLGWHPLPRVLEQAAELHSFINPLRLPSQRCFMNYLQVVVVSGLV